MAQLVVDSSVWFAALLPTDPHQAPAQHFIQELRTGLHVSHLPRLVGVEVFARLFLRTGEAEISLRAQRTFVQWAQMGSLRWYDLTEERANRAVQASVRYRLRGADSVVVALADELNMPVLTFDNDILSRYPKARRP